MCLKVVKIILYCSKYRISIRIHSLTGATEGNATLVNITYRTDACGFWPVYSAMMAKSSMRLVKVGQKI